MNLKSIILLFFNLDEREQANLADDEVGVLLVHGAKTGVDVHAGKRHEDAAIRGGFIVGVKTKVTKA